MIRIVQAGMMGFGLDEADRLARWLAGPRPSRGPCRIGSHAAPRRRSPAGSVDLWRPKRAA